jgi:hypothetical protein
VNYLLSEEEYKQIKKDKNETEKRYQDIINKLCVEVCNLKPVKPRWMDEDDEPEPWGCVQRIMNLIAMSVLLRIGVNFHSIIQNNKP